MHPLWSAKDYNRIDFYSHRHGNLDPCACAHRRKCTGAGSKATRQERLERVGKIICRPSGLPWVIWLERLMRPCPVLLLNCLLAPRHARKDSNLACRKTCGPLPLLREPVFRGCPGFASAVDTTAKAPLGRLLSSGHEGRFYAPKELWEAY